MTMYKGKPNIAIVGLGKWGRKLALNFSKYVNIIYAINKSSEETEKWIKKNLPTAKTEKSLDVILSDKNIDAVVIATPIETHYEIALKCLAANKDIFIEKPMCSNSKETSKLLSASKEKNNVIFTGYVYLYDKAYQKMIELIDINKIREISFDWHKYGSFNNSIFLNLLSHDLAMSIKLLGYPDKVKLLSKKEVNGEINIIDAKTEHNGIMAHYYINRVSDTKNKTVNIKTDNEEYVIENNILYKVIDGEKREIFKSKDTPLENEISSFIKNIKNREVPFFNKEINLDIAKTLERII